MIGATYLAFALLLTLQLCLVAGWSFYAHGQWWHVHFSWWYSFRFLRLAAPDMSGWWPPSVGLPNLAKIFTFELPMDALLGWSIGINTLTSLWGKVCEKVENLSPPSLDSLDGAAESMEACGAKVARGPGGAAEDGEVAELFQGFDAASHEDGVGAESVVKQARDSLLIVAERMNAVLCDGVRETLQSLIDEVLVAAQAEVQHRVETQVDAIGQLLALPDLGAERGRRVTEAREKAEEALEQLARFGEMVVRLVDNFSAAQAAAAKFCKALRSVMNFDLVALATGCLDHFLDLLETYRAQARAALEEAEAKGSQKLDELSNLLASMREIHEKVKVIPGVEYPEVESLLAALEERGGRAGRRDGADVELRRALPRGGAGRGPGGGGRRGRGLRGRLPAGASQGGGQVQKQRRRGGCQEGQGQQGLAR